MGVPGKVHWTAFLKECKKEMHKFGCVEKQVKKHDAMTANSVGQTFLPDDAYNDSSPGQFHIW